MLDRQEKSATAYADRTLYLFSVDAEDQAFFMVRRQREHTGSDLVLPLIVTFTLRILGFQHLLVLRWEWETFSPNTTPLLQILHFAIFDTSLEHR